MIGFAAFFAGFAGEGGVVRSGVYDERLGLGHGGSDVERGVMGADSLGDGGSLVGVESSSLH